MSSFGGDGISGGGRNELIRILHRLSEQVKNLDKLTAQVAESSAACGGGSQSHGGNSEFESEDDHPGNFQSVSVDGCSRDFEVGGQVPGVGHGGRGDGGRGNSGTHSFGPRKYAVGVAGPLQPVIS
jgi:hypothetical protein